MLTKWVGQAWRELHAEKSDLICQKFRKLGLSLAVDGSKDAAVLAAGPDPPPTNFDTPVFPAPPLGPRASLASALPTSLPMLWAPFSPVLPMALPVGRLSALAPPAAPATV